MENNFFLLVLTVLPVRHELGKHCTNVDQLSWFWLPFLLLFSITAELLVSAWALSVADKCHFELNLSDHLATVVTSKKTSNFVSFCAGLKSLHHFRMLINCPGFGCLVLHFDCCLTLLQNCGCPFCCWQMSLWTQRVRPPWQVNTMQEELASQCSSSQTKVWETTS